MKSNLYLYMSHFHFLGFGLDGFINTKGKRDESGDSIYIYIDIYNK